MRKKKAVWKFQLSLREKIGHEISQTKWLRDSLNKYFNNLIFLLEQFSEQIGSLSETDLDREKGREHYYSYLNKRLDLIDVLKKTLIRNEKGQVIILLPFLLLLFLGLASLVWDTGYIMVLKNEIQNVADASALAGCRVLGVAYEGLDCEGRQNYFCNELPILEACKDIAFKNRVSGELFILENSDIAIGRWDWSTRTLEVTLNRSYSVKVIARKKILTLFKRETWIKADATASLMVTNELIPCIDEPLPGERKWSIPALVE